MDNMPLLRQELGLPIYLWEMVFLIDLSICEYVSWKPSGWKMGSQPKEEGPRAGTMRPFVLPTKTWGSTPGPATGGPQTLCIGIFCLTQFKGHASEQ